LKNLGASKMAKKISKKIIVADKESTEKALEILGLQVLLEKIHRFENNPANTELIKKVRGKLKKIRTKADAENFIKDPANAALFNQWHERFSQS
jgi:phosphotransacetylase